MTRIKRESRERRVQVAMLNVQLDEDSEKKTRRYEPSGRSSEPEIVDQI